MNQPFELTVMMYHYVRDPGDEAEAGSGITGLSVQTFESQLELLSRKHTFVAWPEVRRAIESGEKLPDSACLLTFDDGIRDHYKNVYRILRNRGLPGLFFVLDRSEAAGLTLAHKIHFLLAKVGFLEMREALWQKLKPTQREKFIQAEERYRIKYPSSSEADRIDLFKAVLQRDLSAEVDLLLSNLFELYVGSEKETARKYYLDLEQIHEMHAGGMHFGGHSRNHPWFDWISAAARKHEVDASRSWLNQFEAGPWAFAYPYGGLSADSPDILKKHGFSAAFTTRAQIQHMDQHFIGRLDGEEFRYDEVNHA